MNSSTSSLAQSFFEAHYAQLRGQPPMRWMVRMFNDVGEGRCPRLVDLPTGAGKTQLVVIWLLALAWYGKNRPASQPVPRRLVWVVNRRVLVQQVFAIAAELRGKLTADAPRELEPVREGLRALSGTSAEFFQVVELRGQIVADREWAIRPAVPQLIIGTVDQIGSRLLFQGYGLGRWGRPQQAGLLGVDSWIAVDEAHLVPAFVLTLRQLHERCSDPTNHLPKPFDAIFARLPFWLTELSATPGLPPPSANPPFNLSEEEKADAAIADRILAVGTRRVVISALPKGEKPKDLLVQHIVQAAVGSKAARIAVFVREVGVANKVAEGLRKQGIAAERICKITGRLRGYERDRIANSSAFNAFRGPRAADPGQTGIEPHFLIGTAAAEVGLDADADVIFCDFAPLPTLLQRLGRLDRRGALSRRHSDGNGNPPTMHIFTAQQEVNAQVASRISKLATALEAEVAPYSAKLMVGAHWAASDEKEAEAQGDAAKEKKSAPNHTQSLIEAATWEVLKPADGADTCTPPKDWLAHDLARVAAGPVVVPPITDAVLDYFSATTEARSPYLSPHPFLYGVSEDDEGTPLVGVAFRLEVEALRETGGDEEDTEAPDAAAEVVAIFKRFPPLRAELHQVKLSTVREWLASPEAEDHPFVYWDGDQWRAKLPGEAASGITIGPNDTLVLPASARMREPCKKLLEDCEGFGKPQTAISDVLEGVTDRERARYLRTIEPATGRTGEDGAWLWDGASKESDLPPTATVPPEFRRSLRSELEIGSTKYVFRYFRPHQASEQLQYLDDRDDTPGHISRAREQAVQIAEAIAPGDAFLRMLLATAALHHDEGKRFPKWQRAFGRPKGDPEIAKLNPDWERPAPLNGFRHEWESLRELIHNPGKPPPEVPENVRELWRDLLLHLVGAHHGFLRPSISDNGLTPNMEAEKHNPLRLEAAERFARLQRQLGRWRLAYLEALLKTADAEGSRDLPED